MAFGPTGEVPPKPNPEMPRFAQFQDIFNPECGNLSNIDMKRNGSVLRRYMEMSYANNEGSILGLPGELIHIDNSNYLAFFSEPFQGQNSPCQLGIVLNTGVTPTENMMNAVPYCEQFLMRNLDDKTVPNLMMVYANDMVPPGMTDIKNSGLIQIIKRYKEEGGWLAEIRGSKLANMASYLMGQLTGIKTKPFVSMSESAQFIADYAVQLKPEK